MHIKPVLIAQHGQCFVKLGEKALDKEEILKDKKHIQAMEQSLQYLTKAVKQLKQNS